MNSSGIAMVGGAVISAGWVAGGDETKRSQGLCAVHCPEAACSVPRLACYQYYKLVGGPYDRQPDPGQFADLLDCPRTGCSSEWGGWVMLAGGRRLDDHSWLRHWRLGLASTKL